MLYPVEMYLYRLLASKIITLTPTAISMNVHDVVERNNVNTSPIGPSTLDKWDSMTTAPNAYVYESEGRADLE